VPQGDRKERGGGLLDGPRSKVQVRRVRSVRGEHSQEWLSHKEPGVAEPHGREKAARCRKILHSVSSGAEAQNCTYVTSGLKAPTS
jgi:hypothetical protein